MRATIILSALAISISAFDFKSEKYQIFQKENKVEFEEFEFYVELDHFRPQDDRTLFFKSKINRDYYVPGGPLFVFVNDAGTFTTQWLQTGLMYDIAQQLGAALITADHRYFGVNLPTEKASYEELKYLTLEQSLADIAYLIRQVKDHLDANDARVVVWGSGYGGTLAALAREKYPHLVDGAWSSSGIFSLAARTRNTHLQLSQVITSVNEQCADTVRKAFANIDYLVDHDGGEKLQKAFGLCEPVKVESDLNVAVLNDVLFTFIADYLSIYHFNGVENFCNDIQTNDDVDPIESLGQWIEHVYGNGQCRNITYERKIDVGSQIEWHQPGTDLGLRQWYYYKCTQFGLFEISYGNNAETIFGQGVSETVHYYTCKDLFGDTYDYEALYDAVADFEIIYGDKDSYETTNAVFTNGLFDRWYPHAITSLIHNDHSVVMNIPFYARSADLYSISSYDSEELANIKREIRDWVTRWVNPDN